VLGQDVHLLDAQVVHPLAVVLGEALALFAVQYVFVRLLEIYPEISLGFGKEHYGRNCEKICGFGICGFIAHVVSGFIIADFRIMAQYSILLLFCKNRAKI
jgi:hypothetical protein